MQDATIVLIKSCLFLALESMHQQVGKDVCYRRTAAFKAHMRHYINEGKIFNLSVWANTTKKNIAQLQKVQTFEARVATGARKFDHITPTLKQLQ